MGLAQAAEDKNIILKVQNLSTHFFTREGEVKAVDGVTFRVEKGETLAIVGESGSGKTVTALSMLRLLKSPPGKIISGEVLLNGKDILKMKNHELQKVRGSGIAMVLQEPMSSLNPSHTIGQQIMEAVEINQGLKGEVARKKALEMLELVRIPAPEKRFYNYPHELSGGMKQRVMIAIALSCRPQILIADEPTCSLDVTIQAQIMELMKQLKKEIGTTVILITHDLGVVAEMADRVAVMYAGQMVETADVFELYRNPAHPYTRGIIGSIMDMKGGKRLGVIPGDPPNLLNPPKGCRFYPRCFQVQEICAQKEPVYTNIPGSAGRWVKCHFPLTDEQKHVRTCSNTPV
ncbi:ATP-binding cassette domain-containing protein [Thermanaerosceptrum fracticalcis]|uniref:ATP-binding cassette domain-containing protein n=1 Tax=Thermanaerosceptrum fracticalcis TaxID=1712410 RepID=A0A7G6E7J9_THEFR|nr:ABC transporter ATP-binding protein [Thermanaerosceptrum fracticalcis]QNB48053.1 ATP-binding cassette domain-containing protein [Thermanaerosceptrum fracticalcis]